MKKKIISIGVRVVIAVAGLAYVAYALTWTDQMRFPAGFDQGELTFSQPTSLPVRVIDKDGYGVERADGRRAWVEDRWVTQDEGGAQFRPGIVTTCRRAEVVWLVAAFAMAGLVIVAQSLRWRVLMRCRGLPSPAWGVFRLYMVGLFFNSFMPGTTGGDVMKAYYVARRSDRRTAAVMSIVADRFAGLVALVIVAAGGALVGLGGQDVGRRELAAIGLFAALLAALGVVYFMPPLQRGLGVTWAMSKLPRGGLIEAVKQAVGAYRHHKGAVAGAVSIGVAGHVMIVTTGIFSGWALGMATSVVEMAAVLPLVMMAGALPMSFMGFGVMEPAGIALLGDGTAATNNQVVVMLVLIRLYPILYSVLGALFLARGRLDLKSVK